MFNIIIFGTRGVSSTKERGTFFCPQCERDTDYKHKGVRRFFTLYFIPLIPLDKLGEYVECQTCKGTFIPKVLQYDRQTPQNDFLSEYDKAMKHSLVLMMLADGDIDEREKEVVLDTINKFGHNDITMTELEVYINQVAREQEDISTYLKKVAPGLNGHGKEMLIRVAFSVAAADGVIDDSEIELLHQRAEVMEMPKAHLKGVLSDMQTTTPGFSEN